MMCDKFCAPVTLSKLADICVVGKVKITDGEDSKED